MGPMSEPRYRRASPGQSRSADADGISIAVLTADQRRDIARALFTAIDATEERMSADGSDIDVENTRAQKTREQLVRWSLLIPVIQPSDAIEEDQP